MNKQIVPEDVQVEKEERAVYRNGDGKYYLTEEGARQAAATHFNCKCGNGVREKFRIYCDSCEPPKQQPTFKDWDGKTPLYCNANDRYFFDPSEIDDFLSDNEFTVENLDLRICEPNYYNEVNSDYWEDVMPEDGDGDLPKELAEALAEFNAKIEAYGKPASWSPTKYRTKYNPEP
jgi:hypothetical protein